MALLPNGLAADAESLGELYYRQLQIFKLLTTKPKAEHITHVRQCLNNLRSGRRLKVSSARLPKSAEAITGRDWLQLSGASQEFMRTWRDTNIVLDLEHIFRCLDQLAKGRNLENDPALNFRSVSEQFDYFREYDKIVREECRISFSSGYTPIAESQFATLHKAVEAGVFSVGDLLFYCHEGNTVLTAQITRAYINRYVGGIYTTGEPTLSANPLHTFMPVVGEWMNAKRFPRPSGFYVKRLPEFAGGERFATGMDFGSVNRAEIAAKRLWPMSCEAFQLFGVTHKCHADLRRPRCLALPGFYVGKERHFAHVQDFAESKAEIKMLAIDNSISLHLQTLNRRMTSIPREISFGFLEAWKPSGQSPAKRAACTNCNKLLYDFGDFTVCSFCGSIQSP